MATWITHLRIAENILKLIPALAPASFVVGSIAPDSCIPDEKREKLEAVRQRVAYIREYYQRTGTELQNAYNRPYIYLPRTGMDQFVDEASAILFRIYKCLWSDGADTNGSVSALDMEL